MVVICEVELGWPTSVNRRYVGRYRTAATTAYQHDVAWRAKVAMGQKKMAPGEAQVEMTLHFRPGRKHRIDIDNGLKAILDGMSGVVYADDRQVRRLVVDMDDRVHDEGSVVATVRLREPAPPSPASAAR